MAISEQLLKRLRLPLTEYEASNSKVRIEMTDTGWKVLDFINMSKDMPDLPKEWLDKIAVLRIADEDTEIEGVGYHYRSGIYYIDR